MGIAVIALSVADLTQQPEKRRVEMGALLYTSAPMGLFLATYVSWFIQGWQFAEVPETDPAPPRRWVDDDLFGWNTAGL